MAETIRAGSKKLDTVTYPANTVAIGELFNGYGSGWVNTRLVDPGLECGEVEKGEVDGEAIESGMLAFIQLQYLEVRAIVASETYTFVNPLIPCTTSIGVCPPLKPRGTFPCCFCPL